MNYGRYRVIEELGHGSVGVVYRAHDPVIGRQVAVKVVRDFAWLQPEQREAFGARFRAEAEAAGPLHHAHIVTLYDVGDSYLVMEFVDGQTLASLLRARQRLPLPQVLEMAHQVAEALDYAHSRSVVHRGLKPANIMVLPAGGVKVLDFGVARPRARDSENARQVLGSAAYMAPEQLLGQRAEPPADIFSLGVIVYELLTGERPFGGTSEAEIIEHIKSAPPAPLLKLNPALPPAYEPILLRALDKDPTRRYETAGALVSALYQATVAVPEVVAVYPPPPSPTPLATATRPRATAWSRPTWLRPLPVLTVAAAVLAVGLLWRGVARPTPPPRSAPPPRSPSPAALATTAPSSPPPTVATPAKAAPLPAGAGQAPSKLSIISTQPSGALIFIAGVERGTSPLTLKDLPAGPTVVRAEKEGYFPAARLSLGAESISMILQPRTIALVPVDILSAPDGGTLSIDGEVRGKTNAGISLPPGIHVIEIQKEGYQPRIEEVEVVKPDRITWQLDKKPAPP